MAFYAGRAHAPAWVDHRAPTTRARQALDVLRAAGDHGLQPRHYGEPDLARTSDVLRQEPSDRSSTTRAAALAAFDLQLTLALLELGRDVALGRSELDSPAAGQSRRESLDFAASLEQSAEDDPSMWLDNLRPRHPEYASLLRALLDLHSQHERGGWPRVPAGTFKAGASHASVAPLRRRLVASGLLRDVEGRAAMLYDEEIARAVRVFQELHGLPPTGTVDAPTLAAMNVPIETRIRQVELNLDRWRRLPDDLGSRHLLVNIPQFHLFAREHGKVVLEMKVVVGKPGNNTPVFSDEMETVVFSPYWNIPDTIVAGETAPAAAKDPAYLAKNQIEILRRGKDGPVRVDPGDIDWDDPAVLEALAFRQRPGAHNALGHVKFLFPNEHDVYLHDTPADSLFARTGRAFSHGCVRVEEPAVLAEYVLGGDTRWDQQAIRTAMHRGSEEHVALARPIPVHLTYFTAWVDGAGRTRFFGDVYRWDEAK